MMLLCRFDPYWGIISILIILVYLGFDIVKKGVYISKNMNKTTMNDVIGPYWAILGPIGHFLHFFSIYELINWMNEDIVAQTWIIHNQLMGDISTNLDISMKKEMIVSY